MKKLNTTAIFEIVRILCLKANTNLPKEEYFALKKLYENEINENAKNCLKQILRNAQIAKETKRPLCQDTGFVTVFLEIGNELCLIGPNIEEIIQSAVSNAYNTFYFRKSIVENPATDRINNSANIPALIHTDIVEGDELKITVSVKGGGCENISAIKMLTPAQGLEGIKDFIIETVKNAGSKPCPPIRIGIGIGSNFEGAAILSKKALLEPINKSDLPEFANQLLQEINSQEIGVMGLGGNSTCFGVNILQKPCHIASLPVAISISCHSSRHASAIIPADFPTYTGVSVQEEGFPYIEEAYNFLELANTEDYIQNIYTDEIEKIKNLKAGEQILLSGTIYTARDAAHKKLFKLLQNNEQLPFKLKNSIIFYAGPCPANETEIIGPIGPTTSSRMDIYTADLYERGLLATIGKGERSEKVIETIKKNKGKYFTITGGIASLLKNCIKSAKVIAYPELGAEAVYELVVEKLPLIVNC